MGWDPTTVRLVVALSLLLPGPQFLAYIVAWVVMPTDEQTFGWASAVSTAAAPPSPSMPTPPHSDPTI